jgi:hypothetical protein
MSCPSRTSSLIEGIGSAVASPFSALVAARGDDLAEVDLNPVIVHADGCAIVDALVVPRAAETAEPELKRQAR